MKLKFDLQNKKHVGIVSLLSSYFYFGIWVMELEAERQAPGFVALGAIIISTIVFKFLISHRLKMVAICVWVTGLAFLMGYLITIVILE